MVTLGGTNKGNSSDVFDIMLGSPLYKSRLGTLLDKISLSSFVLFHRAESLPGVRETGIKSRPSLFAASVLSTKVALG